MTKNQLFDEVKEFYRRNKESLTKNEIGAFLDVLRAIDNVIPPTLEVIRDKGK